jgi:hypothetical protein
MSNKKRQSRRRVLRGGDDAKPVESEPAVATEPAAESGSFIGNLFSTESKPEAAAAEVAPAAAAEVAPAETSPAAEEEMKPVAAAATAAVMASTYKTKKSKSKAKKGKKCKTAKGNCKKWFKLNKNRLCASASPSM